MRMGLPFPASGFNLVGTSKFSCTGCSNVLSAPMDFTFTYNLTTIVDELELVVEPQDFDSWRPEGAKSEDTPANKLSVKATLQHVSGAAVKPEEMAIGIAFQLATSPSVPAVPPPPARSTMPSASRY
jgi:hypothetical protein